MNFEIVSKDAFKELDGKTRIVRKFFWTPRYFHNVWWWLESHLVVEQVFLVEKHGDSEIYEWVEVDMVEDIGLEDGSKPFYQLF